MGGTRYILYHSSQDYHCCASTYHTRNKMGQYSSGTSTLRNTGQILGWHDPRRIKTTKTLQRYLGRSSATNIKNLRCRRTSSATSEYTKNIYIYIYIQYTGKVRHHTKTKNKQLLVGAKPLSQPSPCIDHILPMSSGGHT